MITCGFVRECFDYKNGELIWKISVHGFGGNKLGKAAGTVRKKGKNYLCKTIGIFGHQYEAHRLIWLYHYGEYPKQLDHIDRNSLNNRIENLRIATDSQQEANKSVRKGNKTGFKGVYWNTQKNKYQAKINCNNKSYHLGYFSNKSEAAMAYNIKAKELYGNFAFLNIIKESN